MLNTIWALVIPNMLGAYNIFIVRNFFRSIPSSLEESARIDGANWFYIWIRIVVPLAKPVIATIALWSLVGHWNAWFDALIYVSYLFYNFASVSDCIHCKSYFMITLNLHIFGDNR